MVCFKITCICRCLLTVSGFEDLTIATSGLGHDVLHISKVVRLAGETFLKSGDGSKD
jgi:hypothetical protein